MFRFIAFLSISLLTGLLAPAAAQDKVQPKVAQYLQDVSVTVRAGPYSGSGVIVQTKDGQVWIWTAAHVCERLRKTRMIIDDKGSKKVKIEFDDAKILRFNKNKDDGRIVSSYTGDAEVIRYSDANHGHDLCLLRLRDKEFKAASSTRFYLDKSIPDIGEDLYHCGSLLGPVGSNSLTSGIMSQHGRVFDGKIYDQTTATSFPGSSGGIVCLKSDGRYVGMLVMGAGEGFGLIVPVRRMREWAKQTGVEFAMDPTLPVPDDTKLMEKGIDNDYGEGSNFEHRIRRGMRLMIWDIRDERQNQGILFKDFFKAALFQEARDGIDPP